MGCAFSAAGTGIGINKTGPAFQLNLKVTCLTVNCFNFSVSQDIYI